MKNIYGYGHVMNSHSCWLGKILKFFFDGILCLETWEFNEKSTVSFSYESHIDSYNLIRYRIC